jgi:hypothetical protein
MYKDRHAARNVVAELLDRGYGNHFWDDMISTPSQGPHGCVLQYLDSGLSLSRWPEHDQLLSARTVKRQLDFNDLLSNFIQEETVAVSASL